MNILQQHEIFEIEVLDRLHRSKALNPLVFGGGTMLRLCHELTRYSVDLDFWFLRSGQEKDHFLHMRQLLGKHYEITDSQIKHYSMLLELRSPAHPKRLKIETRREIRNWDYEEKIAFSWHSTRQVLVKAFTLKQSMENKVAAFLDRGEIRDCFDIEFLLRKGIQLPPLDQKSRERFLQKLQSFKEKDYKVKLGSILEEEMRRYYVSRGFAFLKEKLQTR